MATTGTVDDYLAAFPPDRRSALTEMRLAINAAAPQADEMIAYQIPAVRLDGHFLVSYAASSRTTACSRRAMRW